MSNKADGDDARLARHVAALADTLVDDYDVVDLLHDLVHAAVELLPVEHAGLLLLNEGGQPRVVASTDESARLVELYQLQSAEGGPCVECIRQGTPVVVDNLAEERQRWPKFARVALSHGFASVYALPVRLRKRTLGALNFFGDGPPISQTDLTVAQALADMATISIVQQRSAQLARLEAAQLQQALSSRIVIEQAKGILSEYGGLSMQEAFGALRHFARGHNRRLHEVAADIVERHLPLEDLVPPARGVTPERAST